MKLSKQRLPSASQDQEDSQRRQRIGKLSAKIASSGRPCSLFFPTFRAKRALALYEEMGSIALQMESGSISKEAAKAAQLEAAQKLSEKMWRIRVRHAGMSSVRGSLANHAEKAFPWLVGASAVCEVAVVCYFHHMGTLLSFSQVPAEVKTWMLISAAPAALAVVGLFAMGLLRASARRNGDLSYRAASVVSHSLEESKNSP